VDLADFATDPSGFRVPTYVIADLECFCHGLAFCRSYIQSNRNLPHEMKTAWVVFLCGAVVRFLAPLCGRMVHGIGSYSSAGTVRSSTRCQTPSKKILLL
jgi:hypothetical protein